MKSKFLTALKVEYLDDGPWWRILSPFVYYSEMLDTEIVVPKGFVLDFASVPRVPVAYWLFGSRANGPAAVHDLLYRWGEYSRSIADSVFLEAMAVDGYSVFTRYPMYWGVVLGGYWSYKATPGCLDHRNCDKKMRKENRCSNCLKYIDYWRDKERLKLETEDRAIRLPTRVQIVNYPMGETSKKRIIKK